MQSLELLFGLPAAGDIAFCQGHDAVLNKYAHGIMTLQGSPTSALQGVAADPNSVFGWRAELAEHPEDVPVLREFFRRYLALHRSTSAKVERPAQTSDARAFFKRLERHLASAIPPPEAVRQDLAATVKAAKALPPKSPGKACSFPEGAFLNGYVIRPLHQFLVTECRFSPEEARQALLTESHLNNPDASSGSPVRPGAVPFRKLASSPRAVLDSWRARKGQKAVRPLVQNACPDLAIREPSPVRVVFEAKYFCSERESAAERELVASIYQAFFYRALPRRPPTKTAAGWDYEYACVLMYDASPNAVLLRTWKSLPRAVEAACWTGANVYVMVLPSNHEA